ncbi:hypothetical protein HEK616_46470 [Streptomyces nigrescens]|uniref:Uncharacterized protein n=1 Tax=Streptomyces nigrescens TaxID=1920 RepID=A0ABM7ZXR9_STRNI|nr:hypothetical protein HEK616_46470 [Streptomyces nigrescens]
MHQRGVEVVDAAAQIAQLLTGCLVGDAGRFAGRRCPFAHVPLAIVGTSLVIGCRLPGRGAPAGYGLADRTTRDVVGRRQASVRSRPGCVVQDNEVVKRIDHQHIPNRD